MSPTAEPTKKVSDNDRKKALATTLAQLRPGLEVDLRWKDTDCQVTWLVAAGPPFQRCKANLAAVQRVKNRLGSLTEIVDADVRKQWKKQADRLVASPEALGMDQVEWLLYIDEDPSRKTKGPFGGNAPNAYKLRLASLPKDTLAALIAAHPDAGARREDYLTLAAAGDLVGPVSDASPPRKPPTKTSSSTGGAETAVDRVEALLRMTPQVILYGPPGTGKTRLAKQVALRLLGDTTTDLEDKRAVAIAESEQRRAGRFDLVVFHPSYDYDQFIGGLRVRAEDGKPVYEAASGSLVKLAERFQKLEAGARPACVLIIDEINRGNVPRLLGELLYALEYRGQETTLSYREAALVLPENVFIIATMNTADRSVDSLDVAVRRRFSFFEVAPNPEVVEAHWANIDPAVGALASATMRKLNLALHGAADFQGLGVGPSYFLASDKASLLLALRHQLKPLIHEYERLAGDRIGGRSGPVDGLIDSLLANRTNS